MWATIDKMDVIRLILTVKRLASIGFARVTRFGNAPVLVRWRWPPTGATGNAVAGDGRPEKKIGKK